MGVLYRSDSVTVKIQRPINFINDCDCIVDYKLLEQAIFWYQIKPTNSIKHIYLMQGYPTITIRTEKIFVHRLLCMYTNKRKIKRPDVIHHIDGNRLNSTIDNLEIINDAKHQSLHAKGRPLTQTQKDAIILSNKTRWKNNKLRKSRLEE